MRNKLFLSLLLVSQVLFLPSCSLFSIGRDSATEPAANKHMTDKKRSSQLLAMRTWQVSGAISIRFNNKTQIGSFTWSQRGRAYDFRTSGPLHLGGMRIEGHPGQARLWKNANTSIAAKSPETLMKKELGWYLPVSNFFYWGRAISAPNIPSKQFHDKFGHLMVLRQQGWRIHYKQYQGINGFDLPKTVTLDSQNMHVKIVFKRWRIRRA